MQIRTTSEALVPALREGRDLVALGRDTSWLSGGAVETQALAYVRAKAVLSLQAAVWTLSWGGLKQSLNWGIWAEIYAALAALSQSQRRDGFIAKGEYSD